jgi:undecaprenyl-diphosphatase
MIDGWQTLLVQTVQHMSGWIYWLALLAAMLETVLLVGLFVPGSTFVLLLGAVASTAGGPHFFGILAFAIIGAALGDNIDYRLGRRYGQRWLQEGAWGLRLDYVDHAHAFFARHGGKSVFLARFIPSLKEVAPFIAGAAGMGRGRFFFWNLLGAIGWGLQWAGAGYLFARSLTVAQQWMSRGGIALALLTVLLLLFWYLRRTMLRHGPAWWAAVSSVARSLAQVVRGNPEVQALLDRHPRLSGMLAARLDRSRFQGLPLTLFVLAFGYLLLLFGGLIEDLIVSAPIVALDRSVAEVITALRSPGWITAASWATHLGSWPVVLATVLATSTWLWLSRRRAYLLPLLVSVAGSTLFTMAGKLALHRPRPADAIFREVSYAFPSAHATIAISLFGFLVYIWLRQIRSWPARINLIFAWAMLALVLGASRLVLAEHFLSDVLGGFLVGGMWLIVAIGWSEWMRARRTARVSRTLPAALPVACLFVAAVYGASAWLLPPQHMPRPVGNEPVTQTLPAQPAHSLRQQLPHYVRTALGGRAQPLSIALWAGDRTQVRDMLQAAGWQVADLPGASALLRRTREGLDDMRAPAAPLFWDGDLYTLAFNRASPGGTQSSTLTVMLWHTRYRDRDGHSLWVGVARTYTGLHWHLARRLSPDLDAARDQAAATLARHGCISSTQTLDWVDPGMGQTLAHDPFFTHGELLLLTLSAPCLRLDAEYR